MARTGPTSLAIKRRNPAPLAVAWHVGWAVVVLAAVSSLAAFGLPMAGPEVAALATIIAAAVAGAVFSVLGGHGRIAAVFGWGIAGAAACHLTGGITGPLAAWCLAPAVAATAFQDRRLLALGSAAALAAAALSALDTAFLTLPQVSSALSPWLSLLALGTITLGLAAGLIGFQGTVQRDTRRRATADRILAMLDRQPLLLATLDRDGRIVSAAGATLNGFVPSQLTGSSFEHLVTDADRPHLADALQKVVRTGRAGLYALATGQAGGWMEITLRTTDGDHLIAAVRDARDQYLRERGLEAARLSAEQQSAGKTRFLANMSHELRTPLNAIMGFSDIMRQRLFGPMADRYAEYAQLIHESGSHLLELINDVLDMSKIEAERFELSREIFDAGDAVEAVLRLMRGQAERVGVNLRGVLPPQPLQADADRRALKQIALNLISNALKFTPRGGAVTVTLQGHGDILELIVADTGGGIAQNDLERLGQPYEQAGDAEQRAAGSGLGLSLVRAFARLHGGEMSVESVMGEGTAVTVRMPVLAVATAASAKRQQV